MTDGCPRGTTAEKVESALTSECEIGHRDRVEVHEVERLGFLEKSDDHVEKSVTYVDVLRETQHDGMRPGAVKHLQPVAGFPS